MRGTRSSSADGPRSADGTVYLGSDDKNVYAIDGAAGKLKWIFPTNGYVLSTPSVGLDGTVYIGSMDWAVYAIDGMTGQEKWAFPTSAAVHASSPAIGADRTLYVGSYDNNVYAIDGKSGKQKWSFMTNDYVEATPVIGADGTGAELVTEVLIGTTATIEHHVWTCTGTSGVWTESTSGAIGASISQLHDANGNSGFTKVTVSMPDSVFGTTKTRVRVQAIAQQLATDGATDRIPSAAGAGQEVGLLPLALPWCNSSPTSAAAGSSVTVTTSNLPPGQYAHLLIGETDIGDFLIDSSGNFSATFAVPTALSVNPHAITITTARATPVMCGIQVTN